MFQPSATLCASSARVEERSACFLETQAQVPRPTGRLALKPQPRRSSVAVRAEEANVSGNPLFSGQFMGVLQQSLARQGADALTTSHGPPPEEREHATVEVLTHALAQTKQTLHALTMMRDLVEKQIKAQEKQVDRMEFALNKSRNDAAYLNVMKEMMHES